MLMQTSTIDRVFNWTLADQTPSSAARRLLIAHRQPAALVKQLRNGVHPRGFHLEIAASAEEAIESIHHARPDVILLDGELDFDGLEVQRQIATIAPGIPLIFVTTSHAPDFAITAMKQGAVEVLVTPLESEQLEQIACEAMRNHPQRESGPSQDEPGEMIDDGTSIIGRSPAMREVYKSIGRVAQHDVTVLITGETGTGKELVAQAIVKHSRRSQSPFLALNCAAIPENLLESELFGHEKGAFSGAASRRVGRFEQCHGGTLMLDEIGDMPLSLQAKILRLLQEQTFQRVGGGETIRTNVRLIASTHRDLRERVATGHFREDLYYRLGNFTIHLPPLRDRLDDVALLATSFVRKFSRKLRREVHEISAEAMDVLQSYHWAGNVRELQSVIERAVLLSDGEVLLPRSLPDDLTSPCDAEIPCSKSDQSGIEEFVRVEIAAGATDLYEKVHARVDRMLLSMVMNHIDGNQRRAADILGIARQTLRLRLRELGLSVTHQIDAE
jgi:DNA-binding NtrC family response regulator